jgi:uncharacterized protein YgiM (DUF1202 family)
MTSRLKLAAVLSWLALSAAACSFSVSPTDGTPGAPGFSTPTLAPSLTPRPTSTAAPPTIMPTVAPVAGTTTNIVNVRTEPDQGAEVLGQLPINTDVQIIGMDFTKSWYQILYPDGPDGLGWVAGQLILTTTTPEVPVIGVGAAGTPPAGTQATTSQTINVRAGPGTDFNTLGTLDSGETITLTGKNDSATWLQIYFPGGPDDRAWVSAGFVTVDDTSSLPVLNNEGTPVAGGGTQTSPTSGPTPTPTPGPAASDGDSPQAPALSVNFSPDSSRLFAYTSDLSYPQGDSEDWIQFTPYSPQSGQTAPMLASLTCIGNGTVTIELWQDGAPLDNWGTLACGSSEGPLNLSGESTYLLHIGAAEGSGGLQYVQYTLTVQIGY